MNKYWSLCVGIRSPFSPGQFLMRDWVLVGVYPDMGRGDAALLVRQSPTATISKVKVNSALKVIPLFSALLLRTVEMHLIVEGQEPLLRISYPATLRLA